VQPGDVQPESVRTASVSADPVTGYLVPSAQAVVRIAGTHAEVVTGSWTAAFDGVVVADIARVGAERTVSARLAALAAASPPAAAIASWKDELWLPLTGLDAVRLDGFDVLFVEVIGTCNERCVHCYAESGPSVKSALDRATCEALIDDARALGFRRIQFTGGDPLLCSFLPELLERAAGFELREIYTNGLLLEDRLLDRLAPHRPSFAFSYYSHDAAAHDAITRTKASHRRTRAAIARVVARGLPVRASIVALPQNHDHIEATIEDLRSLGVTYVAVAGSRAVGRGEVHDWTGVADARLGDAHRGTGEAGPEGRLAVTYEGDVVPCIFNRKSVLGRLGAARLPEILGSLRPRPAPPRGLSVLDDGVALACVGCRTTATALRMVGL
jgi:MoaA/NifB/PqqE/SkfB family radical SAM enzyme